MKMKSDYFGKVKKFLLKITTIFNESTIFCNSKNILYFPNVKMPGLVFCLRKCNIVFI